MNTATPNKAVCRLALLSLALAGAIVFTGCNGMNLPLLGKPGPKLFLSLPDSCNTPDGMTLDSDTNVMYLACPNFNENILFPGIIVKINPDNTWAKFSDLPAHPETNRVGPMGLDIGPDGHLYVADNQYFYNVNRKSRLLRVKVKDGRADGTEIAVDGFCLANAVIWRGDAVYVSDTFSETDCVSYIYRITQAEMSKGTVHLTADPNDPHIVATFKTVKNDRGDSAGADGLTFDADGNLYCGLFGNGMIYKISFDAKGKPTQKLLIRNKIMPSADGMFWDAKSNLIYIADSAENAIRAFTTDGKLSTIAQSPDSDGAKGQLDQPCEVIIRGDELIAVCFDMAFPGLMNSEYDKAHTLSVIKLDPKRGAK